MFSFFDIMKCERSGCCDKATVRLTVPNVSGWTLYNCARATEGICTKRQVTKGLQDVPYAHIHFCFKCAEDNKTFFLVVSNYELL